MRICERTDFAGESMAAICPDCKHWILVHPGTGSCAMCRLEEILTPEWRSKQERIQGRPGLFR